MDKIKFVTLPISVGNGRVERWVVNASHIKRVVPMTGRDDRCQVEIDSTGIMWTLDKGWTVDRMARLLESWEE